MKRTRHKRGEVRKNILITIEKVSESAKLPTKAHDTDAGYDCYINSFYMSINGDQLKDVSKMGYQILEPLDIVGCGLGFKTSIPYGYYCQILPRSGNAIHKGLTIVNSPGTIDSGYRGEWIAIVGNIGKTEQTLQIGDKICQIIFRKCIRNITLYEGDINKKLPAGTVFKKGIGNDALIKTWQEKIRGDKGFGSTGN